MTPDDVAARFHAAGVSPDPDELERFAERAHAVRALVESFHELALRGREEEEEEDA